MASISTVESLEVGKPYLPGQTLFSNRNITRSLGPAAKECAIPDVDVYCSNSFTNKHQNKSATFQSCLRIIVAMAPCCYGIYGVVGGPRFRGFSSTHLDLQIRA